jgi:predicted DNA-binding transcriptional regulator YafY
MPVTKNAAFRYRIIDACLRNKRKPYPSIDVLQETITEALNMEKEISQSSINKDLKSMRSFYNAPIRFNKNHGGYYYEDPHFSINSFPLTEDEVRILDLSSSFLKQIKFSGYFTQFESVIEKLISGFRLSKIPGYENRQLLETEEPLSDTGLRWLETVYSAILYKEILEVKYKRFNSDDVKIHLFSPYLLREYRNRWYMVGYSAKAEAVTTLALDRVESIQKTTGKFISIDSFNEKDYFRYSFGVTVYANADPYTIELLFDQSVAGYLLTKPLHSSQKVNQREDGLHISLVCYVTPELEMTILSYGENVKVLGPEHLKNRIAQRAEALCKHYQEKP